MLVYLKKVICHFDQYKIKQKFLLLITLTVFISNGLIFLSSSIIYVDSIKEKAQRYSSSMIDQRIKNIDSYFQGIESIALSIAYNPLIQDSIINPNTKSDYQKSLEKKYIQNALKLFVYSRENLQISIFLENQENSFYTLYTQINPKYSFKEDKWYKLAKDSKNQRIVVLNNPQYYYQDLDRKLVHSFVYKINSMYTQDVIGYIVIDIDKNQFSKFFNSDNIDIENTLIVDENNEEIYSSADKIVLKDIDSLLPEGQTSGHFNKHIDGKEYMAIFGTSQYTGWKIINLISYNTLLKDISLTRYLFLLISTVLFFITVFIFYRFSNFITNPIERLKEGMERVRKGDFQVYIASSSRDELGELTHYFNNMIYQLHHLIQKNQSNELLKKEAELKTLQQQINPHFLYNTLEMMIGLTTEKETDKVIVICKNLGSMFRYNLSNRKTVMIEEELAQIENYIFIMSQRFEGKFKVNFNIDEQALTYKTVKFTFQPFIENTFTHGFDDIVSGGILNIQITLLDNQVFFCLSDNGKGIDRFELESINQNLKLITENPLESMNKFHHLGIMNVHLRLKLLFNDRYSISIESFPNKGTAVKIIIPAIS